VTGAILRSCDAPPPTAFSYTFDHLTELVDAFLEQQRISGYSLYLQEKDRDEQRRVLAPRPSESLTPD